MAPLLSRTVSINVYRPAAPRIALVFAVSDDAGAVGEPKYAPGAVVAGIPVHSKVMGSPSGSYDPEPSNLIYGDRVTKSAPAMATGGLLSNPGGTGGVTAAVTVSVALWVTCPWALLAVRT